MKVTVFVYFQYFGEEKYNDKEATCLPLPPRLLFFSCTPRKASKALVCYLDSQKDFFLTANLFYIFLVNLFS